MSPKGIDKVRVVQVVDELLATDPATRRFGLVFDGARVERVAGGWIVPVWYGGPGVDAYQLMTELDRIQRDVERRLNDRVSVVLGEGLAPAA